MSMNRLWNVSNPYQGNYKKVLCLCSAGLLRSPTAAMVLSQEPYNYNTRAAGLDKDHALIPVDIVLLSWAEEIVVMTQAQKLEVVDLLEDYQIAAPRVICLDIPDEFEYRNPNLIEEIKQKYDPVVLEVRENEESPID